MQLNINGKEVNLKVSVWVVDENRLADMLKGRESSSLLKITALFFMCHQNWARRNKVEPVFGKQYLITKDIGDISELEDWVEDKLSEPEGNKQLIAMFLQINSDIANMFGNDTKAEAELSEEQKKMFGEALGNSPLLKSA